MQDGLDVRIRLKRSRHRHRVTNICPRDDKIATKSPEPGEVFVRAAPPEVVEHDNAPALGEEVRDGVTADKAGATGNQNRHVSIFIVEFGAALRIPGEAGWTSPQAPFPRGSARPSPGPFPLGEGAWIPAFAGMTVGKLPPPHGGGGAEG